MGWRWGKLGSFIGSIEKVRGDWGRKDIVRGVRLGLWIWEWEWGIMSMGWRRRRVS